MSLLARGRRTRALPLLGALLSLACGEAWSPESIVEDLRVLGMRAEPAELRPGESAALTALVVDPTRVGQKNTMLWLGCDPDPFNLGRGACSDSAALQDPQALLTGSNLPPGVKFIGLDSFATYSVARDLFSVLAGDDPRRQSGTVGLVLAIAVAEQTTGIPTTADLTALFERVKNKEVKAVITLFRIPISEAAARNTNPKISGLRVEGRLQRPGVRTQLFPAQRVEVALEAPDSSFEPFVQLTPTGSTAKVEQLTSAWYSTSGRYNALRVALRSEVNAVFTAPGNAEFPLDPVPESRTGTFHVVMRDTRGGQDWIEQPFFLCQLAAKDPIVTAVRSPAARGELVVLEGSSLDGLLEVVVDGAALTRGALNPATGNFEALVPATVKSGTWPLELFSKRCRRVPTSLTVAIP